MALDFSIIVPFFNAEDTLEACLQSLLSQDYPREKFEIIAVDNASTDGSAKVAENFASKVRFLQEERQGSYIARNLAVRGARGRYLAFTDSDCIANPEWLNQWATMFQAKPQAELLLGARLPPMGSDPIVNVIADLENRKAKQLFADNERTGLYYGFTNNLCLKRETFQSFGPFVEIPRGADTLFVREMVDAGLASQIHFVESNFVRHLELLGVASYLKKQFLYGRSASDAGRRHPHWPVRQQIRELAPNPKDITLRMIIQLAAWAYRLGGRLGRISLPIREALWPQQSPLRPHRLRLDIANICQLKCPTCPTASGRIDDLFGSGSMSLETFTKLLDENPWVLDIELSNWGEVFLNPDLLEIMKVAHNRHVKLRADNGVNMNTVEPAVLEGLVRYQVASLNCSIDGATPEVYARYRRKGDLNLVLKNIAEINRYKSQYKSELPRLRWQFVAFEHNLHEIEQAREMAKALNMEFHLKLSWEDLYTKKSFSPVKSSDKLRRYHPLRVANRTEYKETQGQSFGDSACLQLWQQPQVNYDGRLLGCCRNVWGDFGNVFEDGLLGALHSSRIRYARKMLMGQVPEREDIPCVQCSIFRSRKQGDYLRPEQVQESFPRRRQILLHRLGVPQVLLQRFSILRQRVGRFFQKIKVKGVFES